MKFSAVLISWLLVVGFNAHGGISQGDLVGASVSIDSLRLLREQGDYAALRPLCLQYLNSPVAAENKAEVLYFMALTYQIGDASEGVLKTDSIIQLLNGMPEASVQKWASRSRALQASYHRRAGQMDESIKLCEEVIEDNKDSIANFMAIRNISITYRQLDKYDSALSYAFEAESLANLLGDKFRIHQATQNLVNLFSILGEYDKVIEGEIRLLKIATSLGNLSLVVTDQINLGSSYGTQNQPDSAIFYFNKAIAGARELGDIGSLSMALHNLGGLYKELHRYNEAIAVLNETLKYSKEAGQVPVTIRSLNFLAEAYLGVKSYGNAEKYTKEALMMAKERSMTFDMVLNYDLLSKIFEAKGELKRAIEQLKIKHQLEDSLVNSAKFRAIEEIETKYENDRKNEEIRNLKQQTEIQMLQIQQQRLFLGLSIVLALFVAAVIYFVYRQRALKAQTNELITRQKLLRAQINPHFFFNALTTIQSHLHRERDIEASSEYLVGFSKLMRNTLEFSIEELISLEEEIEMVSAYMQLQEVRNNHKFETSIIVGEEIDASELMLPPMLTQPFLENAVEHAFKNRQSKGLVAINYTVDGSRLMITIEDNGEGIASDSEQNKNHKSRATGITEERIRLLMKTLKQEVSFSVDNKMNDEGKISGVRVKFRLPLLLSDDA
ncbi:tetratricopeptide repeat protein [uncultured Imperialibacter sp.]|uniref:tetratricopeptide repeat-containing sensor histidine kinase n=1 Tax=uncultured Imperialibacter sp. TaxID=1672639 RepID=UPI0030DB39BF